MDYEILLELVDQTMRLCIQTTARTEALASLLVDKGLITDAEFSQRIIEHEKRNKKIADAIGSFDGKAS